MYISRIVYDGCCSFQDTNSQGSCLPNALFNLTQNYYYIISNAEENEDTIEQDTIQEDERFS